MELLHLPDNVKVHYAGSEVQNQFLAVKELGVSYSLYTAFPFVEKKVFGETKCPIMPLKWQKGNEAVAIPNYIARNSLHTIQDSGLFTLMFGGRSGKHDDQLIGRWYDALVEFTLTHACGATCVEVDCQKVLGVEQAWQFRQRMQKDLPQNRIINVFHIEDGQKGLDRLIEFSEYIAISVPELRFAGKKADVPRLARYIKQRKPSIDIHLLGCTELKLLKECSFCTSADSTSFKSGLRFGFIKGHHQKYIDTTKVKELVGEHSYSIINEYANERNTNCLCVQIEMLKRDYENAAGNQDYFKQYNKLKKQEK